MTDFDRRMGRQGRRKGPLAYLAFGPMADKADAGDGSCRDFAGRPVRRAVYWREFVTEFVLPDGPSFLYFAPWGFLCDWHDGGGAVVTGFLSRPDVQYYGLWAGAKGLITRQGPLERARTWAALHRSYVILDGIFDRR